MLISWFKKKVTSARTTTVNSRGKLLTDRQHTLSLFRLCGLFSTQHWGIEGLLKDVKRAATAAAELRDKMQTLTDCLIDSSVLLTPLLTDHRLQEFELSGWNVQRCDRKVKNMHDMMECVPVWTTNKKPLKRQGYNVAFRKLFLFNRLHQSRFLGFLKKICGRLSFFSTLLQYMTVNWSK